MHRTPTCEMSKMETTQRAKAATTMGGAERPRLQLKAAEVRSYLDGLLKFAARTDLVPLRDKLETALSSDDGVSAYVERDGTMDGDLLILPPQDHIAFVGVRDALGRPIREGIGLAELREGVKMETRTCPYPGSRKSHEKPMNVTALKLVGEVWRDYRAMIHLVRQFYLDQFETDGVDVYEAARVARILTQMPWYMRYRTQDPVLNGGYPGLLSLAWKIFLGVEASVDPVVWDRAFEEMGGETPSRVSPETLLEEIDSDRDGPLVGIKEVCAGPAPMILETFRLLFQGLPDGVEAGAPIIDEVESWYGDRRTCAAYVAARTNFLYLTIANQLSKRLLIYDFMETAGGLTPGQGTALDKLDKRLLPTEYSEAVCALDAGDRGVMLEYLFEPMFPDSSPSLGEPVRRERGRFVALWTRPRQRKAAELAGFLKQALGANAPAPDSLAIVADRMLVALEMERLMIEVTIQGEEFLCQVLGREPAEIEAHERIADATVGRSLPDFFREAFGLERQFRGGRTILSIDGADLVLSGPLHD